MDGQLARRLDYCLEQHLLRKKQLERMIRSRKFSKIEFLVLRGGLDNPIFCGRSTFLLHKKHNLFKYRGYSYIPWITYMTLRTNETNDLVFCWLRGDEEYSKCLKLLLKKEDHKKTIEVLAYACSDSFAVEKSFYNKHSSAINEIIKNFRSY